MIFFDRYAVGGEGDGIRTQGCGCALPGATDVGPLRGPMGGKRLRDAEGDGRIFLEEFWIKYFFAIDFY